MWEVIYSGGTWAVLERYLSQNNLKAYGVSFTSTVIGRYLVGTWAVLEGYLSGIWEVLQFACMLEVIYAGGIWAVLEQYSGGASICLHVGGNLRGRYLGGT